MRQGRDDKGVQLFAGFEKEDICRGEGGKVLAIIAVLSAGRGGVSVGSMRNYNWSSASEFVVS
jgi:hypothetical protein